MAVRLRDGILFTKRFFVNGEEHSLPRSITPALNIFLYEVRDITFPPDYYRGNRYPDLTLFAHFIDRYIRQKLDEAYASSEDWQLTMICQGTDIPLDTVEMWMDTTIPIATITLQKGQIFRTQHSYYQTLSPFNDKDINKPQTYYTVRAQQKKQLQGCCAALAVLALSFFGWFLFSRHSHDAH